MPSSARTEWEGTARRRLDEMERLVGASGGPDLLVRSLHVMLLAQFQRFARSLHDGAIDVHAQQANPLQAQIVRLVMSQGRALAVKNPTPSALGSDFGRLGIKIVDAVRSSGPPAEEAMDALEGLARFRNAIAHGNESELVDVMKHRDIAATVESYRAHRRHIDHLVTTMDLVVATELAAGLRIDPPW